MKKKSFENINFNDLQEIYSSSDDQKLEQPSNEESSSIEDHTKTITKAYQKGSSIHEAVRDLVFKNTKDSLEKQLQQTQEDPDKLLSKKRKELHEVLDHLDEQLQGKSVKEVTAIFTSLLDIQSQLCLQKTEGVISVRTRLKYFFPIDKNQNSLNDSFRQEISLIFSPEEIKAIRTKLPSMDEDDALQPLFTYILEQAYDVIQYSEMTSHLLIEMTSYFIDKLETNGYGNTPQTLDFKERHERSQSSMKRAIADLHEVESTIQHHLKKFPILIEFPKLLRLLINIKLGLLHSKHTSSVIQQIQNKLGAYARARSNVAFDFNRLPSFQHGIRLRQSIILNLHKDVIAYTGQLFEKEFRACQNELEQLTSEIESASERLEPNSPEFEALLQQKAALQKKIEQQRRKLDVIKTQERLVNVHHQMTNDAIQRFNKNERIHQKLEEQLNQPKIDTTKARNPKPAEKKKPSRMVMAKRRHE